MSVTLTSGSEHFSTLINALRDDVPNIKVYCYDGEMEVSAILLASVCPTIRDIGKDETNLDGNEINLILPDYSISNFKFFAQMLASSEGPVLSEDELFISQTLLFLGYDFKCGSYRSESKLVDNQQEQQHYVQEQLHDDDSEKWLARSNDDYEDKSYPKDEELEEEHTISCQEESNQFVGDDDFMSQKTTRSFKRTGKFTEEVMNSYDNIRRLFICRQCGTERKRSDRLALHLKWHEDNPGENYQARNNCKVCGRFNATYFMLKMHMTRMHSNMPKTFKCNENGCEKTFRFKGELKIHQMTHSQVRNFVCSDCGEKFRSKGQVELHATRRHNPDIKPTIPCEECGKLFRIQADLRNHLSRTHRARQNRKNRCNACDLTFRSEKSLMSHLALHDPSRPLPCTRCTLRYKSKDALVAHEKTHDHAQFACEFCTIAFKRKDNLKRHIKSKHSTMSIVDKLMLNNSAAEVVVNDQHSILQPTMSINNHHHHHHNIQIQHQMQ